MTPKNTRTVGQLSRLNRQVIVCRKCPRLVQHREEVAHTKRRAYREQTYWGRPVPGFGAPPAELLIIGLAPAAHGANRTGRMFTGDRSGEFLYRMLHHAGFANQPTSTHRGDGLALRNCYITAAIRCAPPGNKPLLPEILHCQSFLEAELELLKPRAVLALGRIAFDACLNLLLERGWMTAKAAYRFSHGASYQLVPSPERPLPHGLPRLFVSYHPSQQNTQTGRLTPPMFMQVLRSIKRFLAPR